MPTGTEILDAIRAVKAQLQPTLIYAVSDAVASGKVLMCEETELSYAYIIFHSEAEAQALAREQNVRLIPAKGAVMKEVLPTPSTGDYESPVMDWGIGWWKR